MGLIKAAIGSAGGVLADQWKEYFYCDSLSKDILAVKGQKQVSDRSSNTKGSDNIITNGSGIAVADGQCMIIVEQGKIVEVCAEPGQFTYDSSSEPSIFSGSLGQSIKDSFKKFGQRFTMGGATGNDQRVYYFNTKEILGNKFGTPAPISFRIVDKNLGLDTDYDLRVAGTYSYKIEDPILFYKNVCGNITKEYTRSELDEQLRSEFLTALQPALGYLSTLEIRPNQIPAHAKELCSAINEELSLQWSELRGFKVVSVAIASASLTPEDAERLKNLQQAAPLSNPFMRDGYTATTAGEAMKAAASNESGAMAGFMGMGMAMNQAGSMMSNSAQYQQYQQYQQFQQQQQQQQMQQAPLQQQAAPATAVGWQCACGATNTGKFCQECGAKKPAGAPLYKCDKCGWEPADPTNPPKFCPECGDIFNEGDIQ